MFNTITWGQYWWGIAILLIAYYAYIGVRYYWWELLSLAGVQQIKDDNPEISPASWKKKPEPVESNDQSLQSGKDVTVPVKTFTH